jgi:hypothetical protein
MGTEPIFTCEACGANSGGDALCSSCLSRLEQAAHPPFARQPHDDAIELVRSIGDRLREHLAQRPPCPHCAASPSLVVDLLDAEQASAEIALSLDTLARLARDPKIRLDPRALDMIADAARRWHHALEQLAERVSGYPLEAP